MLLSLTTAVAGGSGKSNQSSVQKTEVKAEDKSKAAQDTLKDELKYATLQQLDSLKKRVAGLEAKMEEASKKDSDSGIGFGAIFLTLLAGAALGVASFWFLKKKGYSFSGLSSSDNSSSEGTRRTGAYQSQERRTQNATYQGLNNNYASSRGGRSSTFTGSATSYSNDGFDSPSNNGRVSSDTRLHESAGRRRVQSQTSTKRKDEKKIVFGNIAIPAKDMLIVESGDFTSAENGKYFQFDLNTSNGTGTYTLAPEIAASAIDRLNVLEPFVEPFDFYSTARKVEIERPGTVVEKDGYWQVESKIVISLS